MAVSRPHSRMKYSQINPAGEKLIRDWPISVQAQDMPLTSDGHSLLTAMFTCKHTLCFAATTYKQCSDWSERLVSWRQKHMWPKIRTGMLWLPLQLTMSGVWCIKLDSPLAIFFWGPGKPFRSLWNFRKQDKLETSLARTFFQIQESPVPIMFPEFNIPAIINNWKQIFSKGCHCSMKVINVLVINVHLIKKVNIHLHTTIRCYISLQYYNIFS